jgi:hypothetical protein
MQHFPISFMRILLERKWSSLKTDGHRYIFVHSGQCNVHRIGGIFGAIRAGFVSVTVDLPENLSGSRNIESPEIMFTVRIVVFREGIEVRDFRPDRYLRLRRQRRNPGGA